MKDETISITNEAGPKVTPLEAVKRADVVLEHLKELHGMQRPGEPRLQAGIGMAVEILPLLLGFLTIQAKREANEASSA